MAKAVNNEKVDKSQEKVSITRERLETLKAQARSAGQINKALQNALWDIFYQTKVVYCLTVNYDGNSVHEGDADDAIHTSVTMLREMTAKFERDFDMGKVTAIEDWGKLMDWKALGIDKAA